MSALTWIVLAIVGIGIYYLIKYIKEHGVFDLLVGGFIVVSIFLLISLILYAKKQKVVG